MARTEDRERDRRNRRDPSERDLFSTVNLPPPSERVAPPWQVLTHVPLTKADRWKRRILITIIFCIAAICVIVAAQVFLTWRLWSEIRAAEQKVEDDGLGRSLEAALALAHRANGGEGTALRARLLATAALEHGANSAGQAQRALSSLDDDDASRSDARIAATYLALQSGDSQAALREAPDSADSARDRAEVARARSVAALATGDAELALTQANVAANARPGSPRHAALLAIAIARTGAAARALGTLDRVPRGRGSPAVRLARGRILIEAMHDAPHAMHEADAILGPLASLATPPQKSWAHLVRARAAAEMGHRDHTLAEAQASERGRPGGDETFSLSLIEALLRVRAFAEAGREIAKLPQGQSSDRGRRAELIAEHALETGNLLVAERVLHDASDRPQAALLKARLHHAKDELDRARPLYERATHDPRLAVEASSRLALLELSAGHPARAAVLADRAIQAAPGHLLAVPVAVRARIAQGQIDPAAALVQSALAGNPNAPELLTARADVEMAQQRWDAALATLRTVTAARSDDADAQASLGQAARRAGREAEARRAFTAALRVAPVHPRALVGIVELALDARNIDAARTALQRVDGARVRTVDANRVRAQFAVMTGRGEAAIGDVRRNANAAGSDPELWVALGRLQLQADRVRDALQSFQRALDADGSQPDAYLGKAIVQIALRSSRGASDSLRDADRAARERHMGDDFFARLLVAQGRFRFVGRNVNGGTIFARQALRKDPRCAEAQWLLAQIAEARHKESEAHLRAAIAGVAPPPAAYGRLVVIRSRPPEPDETATEGAAPPRAPALDAETCEYARHYLEAAPRGDDADRVRTASRSCSR